MIKQFEKKINNYYHKIIRFSSTRMTELPNTYSWWEMVDVHEISRGTQADISTTIIKNKDKKLYV